MSTRAETITQDRLRELLSYDPESGVFTWRIGQRSGRYGHIVRAPAGSRAGSEVKNRNTAYITIGIDGVIYPAHSLAVLYVTGAYPPLVDHLDQDGLNNRWGNLRPCTPSQNGANKRRAVNNTSGIKGVSWNTAQSKWCARLRCQNRSYFLGAFDSIDAAAAAYARKAQEVFGVFARAA